MLDFSNVIVQYHIYVGIPLLIAGVFGNLLNIIVFYKTGIRNSSNLILFSYAWASLAYISIGLSTRVIAVGFLIDWTTTSMDWCRARFYLGHVNLFVSISYMCYAAINQFFVTSPEERLRRLSNFNSARRAIIIILIFWVLHHLPIPILAQQVPTASGGLLCNTLVNPYLKNYISYFTFPIVSAMVPIIFLTIVGILTYRNVSTLQGANVRERTQRNLTSMILLQTVSLIIGSVPYGSYYMYSVITSTTVKGSDRMAIENLIFQIVNVFYYFSHASSFFVYLVSSKTFRNQVKTILHIPLEENRVGPSQSMNMHLRTHTIKEEPIQSAP